MDREEVLGVYDNDEFAEAYNERFLLIPWAKHGVDFELTILRDLLDTDDPKWLDVGCGTGWVLSQFPDTPRAGLDLTPAMLRQAEAANPSALFFRQGDFTHDIEEFHGEFSVVSCMWMAYCYLATMPECEALVENLARWTRPGGSVFIPSVIDLEDLRPHVQVDYEMYPDVWGGRIALTGYNWTWEEPNGNVNENMMAVHVGHFVRLLEPHFEKVEVVFYPVFEPGFVARKAVVATGRRPLGETGEAEVIWHPVTRHPQDVAEEERAARETQLVESWQSRIDILEGEINEVKAELTDARHKLAAVQGKVESVAEHVVRSNEEGEYYDVVGVIHDQVGAIREDLDALSQRLFAQAEAEETSPEPESKPRKGGLRGKIANVIDPD